MSTPTPKTIDPRRNAVADAIATRQGYIGGAANSTQYADADAALTAADANDPARHLLRTVRELAQAYITKPPTDAASKRDFLDRLRQIDIEAGIILDDAPETVEDTQGTGTASARRPVRPVR